GAQPLEEAEGARPLDLDLGEARFVEEGGGVARGQRLRADRGRPVLAGPAPRTKRLERGAGRDSPTLLVRGEPVRALPHRLLAEDRPEGGDVLVRGREPQRPAGLALLVRVMDVVVGRVVLVRPIQRQLLRAVLAAEAPD